MAEEAKRKLLPNVPGLRESLPKTISWFRGKEERAVHCRWNPWRYSAVSVRRGHYSVFMRTRTSLICSTGHGVLIGHGWTGRRTSRSRLPILLRAVRQCSRRTCTAPPPQPQGSCMRPHKHRQPQLSARFWPLVPTTISTIPLHDQALDRVWPPGGGLFVSGRSVGRRLGLQGLRRLHNCRLKLLPGDALGSPLVEPPRETAASNRVPGWPAFGTCPSAPQRRRAAYLAVPACRLATCSALVKAACVGLSFDPWMRALGSIPGCNAQS